MKHFYKPSKGLLQIVLGLALSILAVAPAWAQTKTVTGTVTGASDGLTLPGVSIVIKGTTTGTISDFDGKYSITAEKGKELVFSFTGFAAKTVIVGDQAVMNVVLDYDVNQIAEIVVVGYGTQNKKVTTAASVYVKSEDIERTSSLGIGQAIQGQTAGVGITASSGQPGSSLRVRVRGTGTMGNSDPLYVVDGVPVDNITYLDPTAIERVDVLKDAASAAIYGARAANGVVLVTTKKGKAGKSTLSVNSYYGIQNVGKKLSLLNSQEYMTIQNEAAVNSGLQPIYSTKQMQEATSTNWMDEALTQDAPIQNHSINLTGGNEKSTYAMGVSYYSQEGIIGGSAGKSNYERISFNISTEHKVINDLLTVSQNLTYTNTKNSGVGVKGIYDNSIRGFLNATPMFPVYDANGDFARSGIAEEVNPVASMYYNNNKIDRDDRVVGDITARLKIVEGLTFTSSIGIDAGFNENRSFRPLYVLSSNTLTTNTRATQGGSRAFRWNWENVVRYVKSFGDHNLELMAGMSAQERNSVWNSASKEGLIFDDFSHAYLDNGTSDSTVVASGKPSTYKLASVFGRVNYNYKEKYLFAATLRRDGSSNFGTEHPWAYFPSVSAGWVISDETFMTSSAAIINYLKLRASWGQNGNDQIGEYAYMSTVKSNDKNYYFGTSENKFTGSVADDMANPDLKWETSEQINIGFDTHFLTDYSLTLDFYRKTTKDWLVKAPVLAMQGAFAPWVNGGEIQNQGLEIELGYKHKFGDLDLSVNGNIAFNKNEITRIDNPEGVIHGDANVMFQGLDEMYRAEVGKSVGYFYGLQTSGIFQNEAEISAYNKDGVKIQPGAKPGDVRFVDRNNDGVINASDKTEIGSPNPDMTYGFNLNLNYKGFDFSVYTYGSAGQQNAFGVHGTERFWANNTTEVLSRWHGEGSSNSYPRVTQGSEANENLKRFSDLYIDNADFLRVKSVNLGYDLTKIMGKKIFSQCRLYLAVNNLYTFTKYKGMDPEIGFGSDAEGQRWANGIDVGYYPQARTYMMGLNVKF